MSEMDPFEVTVRLAKMYEQNDWYEVVYDVAMCFFCKAIILYPHVNDVEEETCEHHPRCILMAAIRYVDSLTS